MKNAYFLVQSKYLTFQSLLGISLLLFAGSTLAQESGWWLYVEGGYAFAERDSKTKIAEMPDNSPAPPNYESYKTTGRGGSGLVGAAVGYEFETFENLESCCISWLNHMRLGLGYEFLGKNDVNGDIHEYLDALTYYDYAYETQSQVIWSIGQIDIFTRNHFTPFIDLGLGIAFNRVKGYDETRVNTQIPNRPSADFGDKTSTEFAWRAGLGLNYTIPTCENFTVGVAVRYSDLGEAKTENSKVYPKVGDLTLPISNLELLLGLTYKF